MDELKSVIELTQTIGIPILFCGVVLYLVFKLVPELVRAKKESDIKQQEYYAQRQKSYDEQMQVLIAVAEQGNQVIGRSNAIIEHNTAAITQNTTMHNKVVDALSRDLAALENIQADLKVHDARAENIYHDIGRVLERTN